MAAKSVSDASAVTPFPPDPDSQESTISTVEREIREAGGDAHAIAADVRDFESVKKMVDGTVKVRPFYLCLFSALWLKILLVRNTAAST